MINSTLGISVGDIIRTSYGTGPYIVRSIYGPYRWRTETMGIVIYPWPIIDLMLDLVDDVPRRYHSNINNIRQEGDRWFTCTGDEVFVEPGAISYQIPLLLTEVPSLYPFQDGIDYHAGPCRVWHCFCCERDFNADPQTNHGPAKCPHCKHLTIVHEIIMVADEHMPINPARPGDGDARACQDC